MRIYPTLLLPSVMLMVWILLVYINIPIRRKSLQPVQDIVQKWCNRNGFITETHMWNGSVKQYYGISFKKEHDLLSLEPFSFLPDYKNPCWKVDVSARLQDGHPQRQLRCLPYFYLVGAPKSGTTDLWSRLIKHPQIVSPGFKETLWLTWFRFYEKEGYGGVRRRGGSNIKSFIRLFDKAAQKIKKTADKSHDGIYHPLVTGHGDTTILYENDFWPILPGNENADEPKFTNADYLYHICPQCKIIISLRNPVDRIYSDYAFHKVTGRIGITISASPHDFHTRVANGIKVYHECFQRKSVRSCVYNKTINMLSFEQGRMRVGIYYVYIHDFLKVFPRNQIFIQRFEDYIGNEVASVERIVKFLNLKNKLSRRCLLGHAVRRCCERKNTFRSVYGCTEKCRPEMYLCARRKRQAGKLSRTDYSEITKVNTSKRTKKKLLPMLKDTRNILQNFYKHLMNNWLICCRTEGTCGLTSTNC